MFFYTFYWKKTKNKQTWKFKQNMNIKGKTVAWETGL